VAVGVDGYPEGRDAAALGAAIARVTGAELMLAAVHPNLMVVMPEGLDWKSLREQARTTVRDVRDDLAPEARILVETDLSAARALHRVVGRERCDLLVVGSSRHGDEGRVRIGKRTRQLLCNFECALAIAPRGLRAKEEFRLARIGVGYDESAESEAALAVGAAIADAAGAELRVMAVVDDRLPALGWGYVWIGNMIQDWRAVVRQEMRVMRRRAEEAASSIGVNGKAEAAAGRPADALLELSGEVDVLVIGSRRWGRRRGCCSAAPVRR
jgi:nucleotide-binding universal stress UspA family protein